MDGTLKESNRSFLMTLRLVIVNYKEFLLAPGTIITFISGMLLVTAILLQPASLFTGSAPGELVNWVYLAAALVGSSYIWYSAYLGIREGDFTADIPVTIATIAAIAIGQYSAAAVVAVLLLLGGLLEELVAARADRALDALARLLPDRVTVRRNGNDVTLPLEELVVGDIVIIRSGERIAIDGEVLFGTGSVNQAAINGESAPVDKQKGDTVFAGTLNEIGALEIRATKVGTETTLGQIRRLIAEAQEQKAPIERILDRYAKIYTPVAIILGLLLWWWSGDILRAITMLIIFCPCVMVLATPTALVASIGNAALAGSLVKKGATVEALSNADIVIFDKTGTLTLGEPHMISAIPYGNTSEEFLVRCAASAEKFSEHPIGKAVIRAAAQRNIAIPEPDSCEIVPGLGVKARSGGHEFLLGRPKMFSDLGIALPRDSEEKIRILSSGGRSVILVMIDHQLSGFLVFEDTVRENAQATIALLHRAGIRTVLVTGDNRDATDLVARKVGITEVYADVMPQEKVAIVKRFQAEGRHVVFVGDGVNDGPALATADVGVAMGLAGTDVAIETADVALLSDDLSKLPHLFSISRKAIRTIRQNLVFAVGVLVIAVGLTIPGILTPVTGALLHELSSIPVIANSARLIGSEK
ncbi:cation-translocating P-type ATPase [Methanoregula sp. PtaB.Bin085]|uniref:heavy metal translocating P-type ATPase n=1 Tax=Methanoregula sp. PtaB.Bin085 TaxID=1811680 RepID=UPI0009C5627C|nr:cation-translocating P-type ATPase [Methanoregula sp. PtaB.Bin085]OPX64969.1 MAG: putative copper-exporting P-type ATPase A [Methanoregula sp. PtaB.Bin085]